MNKYELYFTFSIIIILPAPDRYWDGAAAYHVKTFTARSSSAWDLPFFKPPIKRPKVIIGQQWLVPDQSEHLYFLPFWMNKLKLDLIMCGSPLVL